MGYIALSGCMKPSKERLLWYWLELFVEQSGQKGGIS